MNTLPPIKRGDTLKVKCNYKQSSDNTAIDLSTFVITVNILSDYDNSIIEINSNAPTSNRFIDTSKLSTGEFVVTMFDTEVLTDELYYIDFKYTTASGVEQSSKALKLPVKDKLV